VTIAQLFIPAGVNIVLHSDREAGEVGIQAGGAGVICEFGRQGAPRSVVRCLRFVSFPLRDDADSG
jgi:hypothetical protein